MPSTRADGRRGRPSAARIAAVPVLVLALGACAPAALLVTADVIHDRRTVGTVIDDESIELRITDAIYGEGDPADGQHVRAISYNRIVLLIGEVESEDVKLAVAERAATIPDVRRIVNELTIGEPSSFARRTQDKLISSRVKTALLGVDVPGFAPQRVKVVTARANVYLMGLLTRSEAARVTNRVARVPGVASVVRIFEYLPEAPPEEPTSES